MHVQTLTAYRTHNWQICMAPVAISPPLKRAPSRSGASSRSVGRAAPVSAGIDAARSSLFSVRHSEQIQSGCARPRARRRGRPPLEAAGGLVREHGDRRQGQAGQKGTAVSHYRRLRVPGGCAHPRPGDHLRVTGCPACSPEPAARRATAAQRPASGGRGCAALAATRAPGYEPHDDEYGHRDQSDDDKRLERSDDPARRRDGKPDGEDRAEDCPDDPAHVPSMPPGPCRR